MNGLTVIISPPMRHPMIPALPRAWDRDAENVGDDAAVAVFDAAMDFYQRYLLDGDRLRSAADRVIRRLVGGVFANAPPSILESAESLQADPDLWIKRFDTAGCAAERLPHIFTAGLIDMAGDLELIGHLTRLWSAAFFPLQLDISGLSAPGLNSSVDIAAFCGHDHDNPFRQYAQSVDPFSGLPESPRMGVFMMRQAHQAVPAAVLLSIWKKRGPLKNWIACGAAPGADAVNAALGITLDDLAPEQRVVLSQIQAKWSNETGAWFTEARSGRKKERSAVGDPPLFVHGRLHDTQMAKAAAKAKSSGCGAIIWREPQGEFKAIATGLYQSSREQIWNHLELPADDGDPLTAELIAYASKNPTIVHSWCTRDAFASLFSASQDRFPLGGAPYGRTAPLPGIPFWQILHDPTLIALFRKKLGVKTLARMRYRAEDRTIFHMGERLAYHFSKPGELPDDLFDEICRMVEAGGSVGSQWLRYNLERAFLIAYVRDHDVLIGNSCLKHPRKEYIEAVSTQSGIDLRNYLERGYTSVRPEYRGCGIGAGLLEGLTQRAGQYKLFSIIGEENVPTQKMAVRNRTRKVAVFFSHRIGKRVGVWIPEWMLPEGVRLPRQPDFDEQR